MRSTCDVGLTFLFIF